MTTPFRDLKHKGDPARIAEHKAAMMAVEFLDRAAEVLAGESGMIVCWHELTPAEVLESDCVQCLVDAALRSLTKPTETDLRLFEARRLLMLAYHDNGNWRGNAWFVAVERLFPEEFATTESRPQAAATDETGP